MSGPPDPNSPLYQDTPQLFGDQSFPHLFLDDIRQHIVDASGISGLTKDLVFLSRHSDAAHIKWPPGDQFIAISLPGMAPNQSYVSGGGSYNTQLDGTLLVRVFDRIESDIENRDANQLTDQVIGELKLVRQVLTAFQTWVGPVNNDNGLSVFNRMMRLVGQIQTLDRDGTDGRSRWGITRMNFEMPFVADLDYPLPTGSLPPATTGPNYFGRSYWG